jgi:hypothetical protein
MKLVVNETQWRLFEEAGADMSQYVLNELVQVSAVEPLQVFAGVDLPRSVPFTRTASPRGVHEGSRPPTPPDACSMNISGGIK